MARQAILSDQEQKDDPPRWISSDAPRCPVKLIRELLFNAATNLCGRVRWKYSFHGVRIEPQFSITDAQGRSLAALSQHMRSAGSIWATMDPNP
ncbi:hypothetical protein HZH68_001628 [Vespula germanica]|uniref:Uncharacterized protein n=1 Tax=Vespula germanica TaxID=30212 RepID=A0A834NVW2_VESGE|nr:hypothetical protein HZH68_001628 [Vespula germanica]